ALAHRARCRLRRHRHQPALRAQGVLRRPPQHPGHARARDRGDVAGVLVDQLRGLLQVRQLRDPGRQPRRGGHPRAAGRRAPPGLRGIAMHPSILKALNPAHAIDLFLRDGVQGFLVLGSVVLVLTGAEALYADMGHFGRRPIRITWFAVVLPCLLLNYFGQAALLLERPEAAVNPFYSLVPAWGLYPMVVVATAAA